MTLADGSAYPHPGRIIFADRQVNMQTGTIQIVGEFPNARNFLRPLMMTALAFILGCVPLWTASGAGAVARQIMGTAVIGGMLAETFIGRFFVPAIFYVVEKVSGAERRRPLALTPAEAPSQGD
jgi:HAE1 family hydrophobic/amphiphilic exporter-1